MALGVGHCPGIAHWDSSGLGVASMARVVVVLLRQRDDQLKIRLPWMEVHILPSVIN